VAGKSRKSSGGGVMFLVAFGLLGLILWLLSTYPFVEEDRFGRSIRPSVVCELVGRGEGSEVSVPDSHQVFTPRFTPGYTRLSCP
jgi:hypothetical protein